VAADVGAVLSQVVEEEGRVPGVDAAAKTGSQQFGDTADSSDAWTAGWASGLAAAVWVGRDKPGPIRTGDGKAINGDGMPYEIFRNFLSGALAGRQVAGLPRAAHVGREDTGDLESIEGDVKMVPGLIYQGPRKGDQVDRSLAVGTWRERVARLDAALAEHDADFSVSLVDRRTGHRYDYRGNRAFETASVVKMPLLAALLLRAQDEGRGLTAAEQRRARKMIVASDNDAAVRVYAAVGGASGLREALGRLGLDDTDPDPKFGLTTTTAKDQTRMVSALTGSGGPLTEDSKALILQLMGSVNADKTWGVSAASFEGESTAQKNGWMSRSTEDNRWIVNSTGRIHGEKTDVALSVLSHGHRTREEGIAAVERIAATTRSYLGW
jgi:membrane peptidoglycan carboxypeptidase